MGKKKATTQEEQPAATPATTPAKDKKSKKQAAQQQKPAPKAKQQAAPAKTKAIKKQEKPARQQEPVQQPPADKKSKPAKREETKVEIFTPEFYGRLNTFQTYYKEVLELKSSSTNSNLSDELTSVNTRVRESLQEASSRILKEELVGLEQWIESQQKRLRSEISEVQKCLESTRKTLQATKAFTVDEVNSQLTLIEKRIAEKQSQLNHYGVLLTRSRNIYEEPQGEKVEARQEANNDNNENNAQQNEDQPELDLE